MSQEPNPLAPFHLAIPVDDLGEAESFYGETLGCPRGRRSDRWIDFNFFGHQLVVHLAPDDCGYNTTTDVDGHQAPAKHFGLVMAPDDWRALAARLSARGIAFLIAPNVRFRGEPGEQGTFFVLDPAGNALEFKCFENAAQLFAT